MIRKVLFSAAVCLILASASFAADKEPDIEMVFVKGGCFDMGDTFGDGNSNEKPAHKVCVDDFYMGKYEVTQKQWMEVMDSNPSSFKGCDNCPVENVSWGDIQDFVNTLNDKTGQQYRLPSEAEWEYAARSGGKREKWAGTSDEAELEEHAWYEDNSGDKTHPVGKKRPNGLGLHDMAGNVWEWVKDRHASDYYKKSPKDNPRGPSNGSFRVNRGGSWYGGANDTRATRRFYYTPEFRDGNLGFRLVRTD